MQCISAERIKGRRRYDLLLCAGVGLIVLLWGNSSSPNTADDLANGYLSLLYTLPLMNTILMPIAMAVIASRAWDLDAQYGNLTLLFTLQSRESLFAAKVLKLMVQNMVICAMEGLGVLLIGRLKGYTGALPYVHLVFLLLATFTVNGMLLFLQLLVSMRTSTQVAALGTGAVFSLVGVFSAYMPPVLVYTMPWAYYVPMGTVHMDWDAQTRIASFDLIAINWGLLALTAALAVLLCMACWRTIKHMEV